MSDVLRQIDEDLRKDRLIKLWKKYGVYLIVLMVLGLILITGIQINKSYKISQNEKIVERYIETENIINDKEKLENLSQLSNEKNEYIRNLSKLKSANLLIKNNKIEQGLMELEQIILSNSYDILTQDLALYYYLIFQLDKKKINNPEITLSPQRIEKSPLKYMFKEMIALKNLLDNDTNEAEIIINEILIDPNAPADILSRVEKYLQIIK